MTADTHFNTRMLSFLENRITVNILTPQLQFLKDRFNKPKLPDDSKHWKPQHVKGQLRVQPQRALSVILSTLTLVVLAGVHLVEMPVIFWRWKVLNWVEVEFCFKVIWRKIKTFVANIKYPKFCTANAPIIKLN